MPSVRILDNVQLEANTYIIKIKEVDAGTGRIWPNQYMVMDPGGSQVNVPGLHTTEPTFGLPATWVDASLKEEAALKGYTVVDAATVLSTHLTELLKSNMSDLLSYGEVQKLLKELPKEQSELVKDIVPAQVTISGIQRVLQLLSSPSAFPFATCSTILEGIAAGRARPFSGNPATMVEHVRAGPCAAGSARRTPAHNGYLPLIALSAKWEQAFAESIIGQGEDKSLAMQPSKLSEFMAATRDAFERAAREGESPVLVTSAAIRPFVRSLVERFRQQTTVLSQAEIHPRARLKTVGSVFDRRPARCGTWGTGFPRANARRWRGDHAPNEAAGPAVRFPPQANDFLISVHAASGCLRRGTASAAVNAPPLTINGDFLYTSVYRVPLPIANFQVLSPTCDRPL